MIHTDHRGDIAIVRAEHGKANALDLELCRTLQATLAGLADEAAAVVLTGSGRIFSAGVDLTRLLEEGPTYVEAFIGQLHEFCEAVFSFPNPLIAAINGHAIAGGCVLSSMADRRIMAEGTWRIGVPELLVGVPFPAAPLEVMRFILPAQYFGEVVFGGVTYQPDQARERGLVDGVVSPEGLIDRAVQAAESMAVAPEAFRHTKAQARQPALERMRSGSAMFDAKAVEIWTKPSTLAAIRDYVERTLKKSQPRPD
jgi:enoyl-CoA hydratase